MLYVPQILNIAILSMFSAYTYTSAGDLDGDDGTGSQVW